MLALLGLMTVYSAQADWGRQLLWLLLGACAYAAASSFDYRSLRAVAPGLYAGMTLSLLGVPLGGTRARGARRWLSVAGFPLEPSELSKLLFVVVLAAFLSRSGAVSWRSFGLTLVLVAPPAALILTQPDLGTTIVFVAVLFGVLFLARARAWQLFSLLFPAGVPLPLLPHLLPGYHPTRPHTFPDP